MSEFVIDPLKNDGYPYIPDNADILPLISKPVPYIFMVQDNSYPYVSDLRPPIKVINKPVPCIFMTSSDGDYPSIDALSEPQKITDPMPYMFMGIRPSKNNGYPYANPSDPVTWGAFYESYFLNTVNIPISVKKIGEYAFAATDISSVRISSDCEIYQTSFPDNCQVERV